jgi:hypothetical protein
MFARGAVNFGEPGLTAIKTQIFININLFSALKKGGID